MIQWTGHVAVVKQTRNAYRILVGECLGEYQIGRTRRKGEDNIKMDLKKRYIAKMGGGWIWFRIMSNAVLWY
jgi:hypothetical protein